MSGQVTAAIITTIGALGAAFIAVFKEEIKSYRKRKHSSAKSIMSGSTILQVSDLTSNQDAKPLSDRKRPFDTNIQIEKAEDESSFIFYMPSSYQGIGGLLFTSGWLVGWTAGIGVASFFFWLMLFYSKGETRDLFGTIFVGGWLIAAIAGEFMVIKQIKSSILKILGKQIITLSGNILYFTDRIFGIDVTSKYQLENIDGFLAEDNEFFFRYGKKRIQITDLTDNEIEWLKPQLEYAVNILLAKNKHKAILPTSASLRSTDSADD